MSRHVDAVVIGAGLGGMSAAANLAFNGIETMLLERHNVPGGYATSFVRGRFEFEVALHKLSGIGFPGHRGNTYSYLEELGVTDHVNFINIKELYRSLSPNHDIVLPSGREEYTDTLIREFPKEQIGMQRFVNHIFNLKNDVDKLIQRKGDLGNKLLVPIRFRHLFRYLPVSLASILNREVGNPTARAVITQNWGYIGTVPREAPLLNFGLMLASYIEYGAAYPVARSQALSNGFIKVIEAHGGEARMNCGVSKIILENGRAAGVVTESGEEIRAKWVVSNADPITTARELVGKQHIRSNYLARFKGHRLSPSSINVYLGLNRSIEHLGIRDHEVFINDNLDLDSRLDGMHILEPAEIVVTAYNTIYPDISPPGTSIVVLTSLVNGAPWFKVSKESYYQLKFEIAKAMLDKAERVYPGLRNAAEVVEVSTPITNMRYINASEGNIYGLKATPWCSMALLQGCQSPIDGLVMAGVWNRPGPGFGPAIVTGRAASAHIVHHYGKKVRHVA